MEDLEVDNGEDILQTRKKPKSSELLGCLVFVWKLAFISEPEPNAQVSYWDHSPSVVRKVLTFSTSSPKPLQGFQRNFTGSKYPRSSLKFVHFGRIPPGVDPGLGQLRSQTGTILKNLLLQNHCMDWKTKYIWVIYIDVLFRFVNLVEIGNLIFDTFFTSFWT